MMIIIIVNMIMIIMSMDKMIMTILTTVTIYISGYINLLFVGPRTHIDGHQPCQ